jgi:nuclear migration protein JNM1
MAAPSRLAALPGYDTAPDVYETPDLTDDASTTQRPTSSEEAEAEEISDSTSATSDSASNNSESESGVVSRRRLKPSHARERFTREGKGVEVKGGRFGDRVGGLGGRGYRVGAVSRRHGEDQEGLAERVARLRREVEECRVLAEREGASEGVGEGEMEGLKRVLEGLEMGKGRVQENGVESYTASEETGKGVAEFDARLTMLEKSLGLSSLDGGAPEAPLLPSLALLDRQFGALMTASSITSLEAASGRIKKLKEEADQLSSATTDSPAKSPQQNGTSTPDSDHSQSGLSASDVEKLRSLHNLLPTLQSLSPTVPALLDRLRSLHTLHVGAANAAGELEDLERRQDDFEKELTEWREGLDRVEKAVKEADDTNGRNGKVVREWVDDIEGRMSKLG